MTALQERTERHMKALGELIEWSIDNSWSFADDIMPNLPQMARCKRLTYLLNRGFAEMKKYPHEPSSLWRVTPTGREAYREYKELAA
jgi:hypothetical protein